MNSSPTPNSPTPSRSSPEHDRRSGQRLAQAACLLAGALALPAAQAHGEADDPLPAEPGLSWDASAALRALHRSGPLPSTRLGGYLLQGDAGMDPQGGQLEHGTLGLAGRLNDTLGARLVLGKHGSERVAVEEAWVQARLDAANGDTWWLNAGRVRPAMGDMLGSAGHFDRSGLAPLAHRMAWDHDWQGDGAQLSWRRSHSSGNWSADLGLWRGGAFPGAEQARTAPSLHLGWAQGPWRADTVLAQFDPRQRGTRASANAGHVHGAPECTPALLEVVCFSGRSRLAGASLRWDGRNSAAAWPVSLGVAGWLRREQGSLESANGLAQYSGRSQGGWLDAAWHLRPGTELGWRAERVSASHALQGPGATLLAQSTRLTGYAPVTRHTLVAAQHLAPWAELRVEAGRESQSTQRAHFVAVRLLLKQQGELLSVR